MRNVYIYIFERNDRDAEQPVARLFKLSAVCGEEGVVTYSRGVNKKGCVVNIGLRKKQSITSPVLLYPRLVVPN